MVKIFNFTFVNVWSGIFKMFFLRKQISRVPRRFSRFQVFVSTFQDIYDGEKGQGLRPSCLAESFEQPDRSFVKIWSKKQPTSLVCITFVSTDFSGPL